MDAVTETTGKYYPVRDSCDKDGETVGKCVYTQALFYQSYVSVSSGFVSIELEANSSTFVNQQYESQRTNIYTRADLGCDGDDDDEYVSFSSTLL